MTVKQRRNIPKSVRLGFSPTMFKVPSDKYVIVIDNRGLVAQTRAGVSDFLARWIANGKPGMSDMKATAGKRRTQSTPVKSYPSAS
jgi:hypothetical protein